MEKRKVISRRPVPSSFKKYSDRIPPVSNEKWEQIFGKLNQIEVAQARLVCPYWRNIIDNNYKFSIIIAERSFEQLPVPFKTKTCSIYRLKKHANKIFKYPYNIENLKLLNKINLSTLGNIFKTKNKFKDLDVIISYDNEEEICLPEEPVQFKKLLQLHVLHTNRTFIRSKFNACITNTQRIFSYEMPLLQRLDVRIVEQWEAFDKILPSFFTFLAKHNKTIKQIRANFIPDSALKDEEFTPLSEEVFNEMQPQNIMELLDDPEFQLTTLILALSTRYFRLWERIMNNQKKLITFYIQCTSEYKYVDDAYEIPFNTLQPTLVRNASTLVNLHLTHLTLEENQNPDADLHPFLPIDGTVFKGFNELRTLILRRSTVDSIIHRSIRRPETTFVNISSIPLGLLEVLDICRLVCETSELERLVENAPRLKKVIFHFTGHANGKGVTTGILDNLLKKRDIHIVDVIPLNLPRNKTEAKKKLAKLKEEYPETVEIYFEQIYHFNFDRFRKGRVQGEYFPYEHPVCFE